MDDNPVFLELSESLPFRSANPDGPFSEWATIRPERGIPCANGLLSSVIWAKFIGACSRERRLSGGIRAQGVGCSISEIRTSAWLSFRIARDPGVMQTEHISEIGYIQVNGCIAEKRAKCPALTTEP